MIRIPTGPVPAKTARTVAIVLGAATGLVSLFVPQYSPLLRELAGVLAALGITVGNSAPVEPVRVPRGTP